MNRKILEEIEEMNRTKSIQKKGGVLRYSDYVVPLHRDGEAA